MIDSCPVCKTDRATVNMNFFSGDPAPPRPAYAFAPPRFIWRYTLSFGPLIGLLVGLGLGAVSGNYAYYLPKEIILGLLAGLIAPLFITLARKFVSRTPGAPDAVRYYLCYLLAGLGTGIVVFLVNGFYPSPRVWYDPANFSYLFGITLLMLPLGLIADAVWTQRSERARTRAILGQYVSEPIATRVLDAQTIAGLEGETRTATILISDIRGFTRMLQELGAEQVVQTLNDYFTRMIDVIAEYGGTVDKFIGDAIVVLYNAPLAQPDANARAIATARAMQSALDELNLVRMQANLPPIHIGIAIDVGEVVCGNIGSPRRLQYTAIGAPVNTAYHLASLAPAQTIYVTENVYQALDKQLQVTLAEQVELKGGTGMLNVYALKPVGTE